MIFNQVIVEMHYLYCTQHSLGNSTLRPGKILRSSEANFQDIAFKSALSILTRNSIRDVTLEK